MFIEFLVIKQVMYQRRQAPLQTRNVALAIWHISSFVISLEQGKRERYKHKNISMYRALTSLQHFQERDPSWEWMENALHNVKWELRNTEDDTTISISSFCFKMDTSRWPSKQNVFFQVALKWSALGIKQLRREDGSLTKDGSLTEDESKFVQIATTYWCKGDPPQLILTHK